MKPIKLVYLSFLSFSLCVNRNSMTAIELVNDMGMGWNLGNTFECFGTWKDINDPDDQITMWGNVVPTEKMVTSIQKYGFKTVRFPVTWMNFIDEQGSVNKEWMSRVKEVVDWIYNADLYIILNVHHDGVAGNWLSNGKSEIMKYRGLWKTIANEFKDYDRRLVFESMNEVEYKDGNDYDYDTLVTLNQAFVGTVRATGGNNADRLLLLSGANTNLEQTCSDSYRLPKDSANMFAISIHYYLPSQFTVESDKNPWTWTDDNGIVHEITPMTTWGTEADYKEMVRNFEKIKAKYTSQGIPVILGEVGVLTEEQKESTSIREFLQAEFAFSSSYDGVMSCLWDTSKNTAGDMNYYNREEDRWYDEGIQNDLYDISIGNYINPTKYYISTNSETTSEVDSEGNLQVNIGIKTVKNIVFIAKITGTLWECGFGVAGAGSDGQWFGDAHGGQEGVENGDGTYTYTILGSNMSKVPHDYIQVQRWWGNDQITLISLTVEFEESEMTIDYETYKNALNKVK